MSKKFISRIMIAALALAGIFAAAAAFSEPSDDPTTSGFQSPCAIALSKDDSCTYDRSTDSLEAISDKLTELGGS